MSSVMKPVPCRLSHALTALLLLAAAARAGDNLVADPSFEEAQPKDRFGHVFAHWSGWIYEGACEFRVSDLAHSGKHSLLMIGSDGPKIRAWPGKLSLDPGRYRVTAYLRGLDIGKGAYGQTTEFMFAGNYMPLKKNGTFGWSKLTYVGEVKKREDETSYPSFGLMAPGYLWVDDVSVEKVGDDAALTPEPTIGDEEKPMAPPADAGAHAVRCPDCGYRNDPSWGRCYACGAALEAGKSEAAGPPVKVITSFEEGNPFDGGTVVEEHATDGKKALRIDHGFAAMDGPQNWAGYDYLKADVYTDAKDPLELTIEVRDRESRDYWTRVNYTTVIPPGASTLVVPTALYVGEKSRPGRSLLKEAVTRLVFSIGDKPAGAAVHRQRPPGARYGDRKGPLRRPVRLRRRPRRLAGHGGLHAARPRQDLQQGPRLRLEGRPLLARLRRAATRPALRGFHLHRAGRPGHRPAQRQVPRLRQHGFAVRLLGRVPALPQARPHPQRRPPRRHDGPAIVQDPLLPQLGQGRPAFRKYLRQIPGPVFQREGIRHRGARRPAEHRLRGRELGLLRLGGRDLPGRQGRAGAEDSWTS